MNTWQRNHCRYSFMRTLFLAICRRRVHPGGRRSLIRRLWSGSVGAFGPPPVLGGDASGDREQTRTSERRNKACLVSSTQIVPRTASTK
jgi:hypothetical protein